MSDDANNTQYVQRQIEYRRYLKENNLLTGPEKIGRHKIFRNGQCVFTTDDRRSALSYIYSNTKGLSYDDAMKSGWGYMMEEKCVHGKCGDEK